MSKQVLLTFSGKYGDILWSLPTARELHLMGDQVDLMTMPSFFAVHPLIQRQPYIRRVFALPNWTMIHDNCGAWPRVPPGWPQGYDEVHHLTYERRPTEPLIQHAPTQIGVPLTGPVLPFLDVEADPDPQLVAYGFNPMYLDVKMAVLGAIKATIRQMKFVDVVQMPFLEAAAQIKAAQFFVGCRSSNYVIAHALWKRILTIEPEPGRRERLFSCPYGREEMPSLRDLRRFTDIANVWAKAGS